MIAMAGLDGGRIGMASQGVGVAEGALEAAVEYSKQRVQFGKPINANQGLQWYLADMATRTEAAKCSHSTLQTVVSTVKISVSWLLWRSIMHPKMRFMWLINLFRFTAVTVI